MAGILTKKNELHFEKTLKQIDAMYQTENKHAAIDAAHACKDIRKYPDLGHILASYFINFHCK